MVDTGVQRQAPAGGHRYDEAFRPVDHAFMLGAALIWGASFFLIAKSLVHHHPAVVAFVRIAAGALAMSAYRPARAAVDRRDLPAIAALAVLWLALPMTLYPLAQQHISSGLAGMLGASVPVFTALIVAAVHRHLPAPIHVVGIGVGALGITLLGLRALRDGSSSALGVVLVLAACVCYAVAFVVAVPLVDRYGAAPVFWRALLASVPLTIPYAVVGLRSSTWGASSIVANLLLGVGGTAIAFVLLLNLTAHVGPTRSSMVTYLEAGFAFAIGTVIAGEPVHLLEVVGCAVLLGGAWLASLASRRAPGLTAEPAG